MKKLCDLLKKNTPTFHPVINFDPKKEKLYPFNFTSINTELTTETIANTELFSQYIQNKLNQNSCKFGIGGYAENRVLYQRSNLFNGQESRSIHLGIDIWGDIDTPIFAPLGGMVHSLAYNDNFGDYGATIILQHQLETVVFHTLYGHLSLKDIANLQEGKYMSRGQLFAHIGSPKENGNWPPHLHFQIIEDMNLKKGDFPGVCKPSESENYLANCPNADLILNMLQYL